VCTVKVRCQYNHHYMNQRLIHLRSHSLYSLARRGMVGLLLPQDDSNDETMNALVVRESREVTYLTSLLKCVHNIYYSYASSCVDIFGKVTC